MFFAGEVVCYQAPILIRMRFSRVTALTIPVVLPDSNPVQSEMSYPAFRLEKHIRIAVPLLDDVHAVRLLNLMTFLHQWCGCILPTST